MTIRSLLMALFAIINLHLFSQDSIVLNRFSIQKCYAVTDSVTGFFGPDSTFIYHGPFSEFNRQKLFVEGSFLFGKKNGVWKKYYPDGKLCTKGMYTEDQPHGAWKYYYETDTLSSVFYYNRGKKVGVWIGYGYDGKKNITQEYNQDGKLVVETFFYPSNGKIAEIDSIEYRDSDSISYERQYFKNGNLYVSQIKINGVIQGEYLKFHDNGKLWEKLIYKNDQIVEVIEMKSRSGDDLDYGTFANGTGILKRYHMNGKVWHEQTYKGAVGTYSKQIYNYSGVIHSRGEVVNGNLSGPWVIYKGGKRINEFEFFAGQEHYKVKVYYSSGYLETEREFKNGLAHGEWKTFDGYGKVVITRNYKLGYLHGAFAGEINTTIKGTGFYEYGNPKGPWNFYNPSNDNFLYSIDYPIHPSFDSSGVTANYDERYFGVSCHSGFEYTKFTREESFYPNDQNCLLWNAREERLKQYAEWTNIPNGIVEVRFKVGLMGEINELKTTRCFEDGEDAKVMRMVYSFPYLKPSLYGGIPVESTGTFSVPHAVGFRIK